MSNESGADEVYVTSVEKPGKRRISLAGGTQPQWRGDGRELFFIGTGGRMMAVDVKAGDTFEAGPPVLLFNSCFAGPLTSYQYRYHVSRDGQRILWLCPTPQSTPPSVTVVVNWTATLGDGKR